MELALLRRDKVCTMWEDSMMQFQPSGQEVGDRRHDLLDHRLGNPKKAPRLFLRAFLCAPKDVQPESLKLTGLPGS